VPATCRPISRRAASTWNGRRYRLPVEPTVVVCVDGCEYDYLERAVAAGVAPFLGRMIAEGTAWRADSVVPTFTNPNNLSIVCGVPPSMRHLRQLLLGRDRRRRPRRRSDDERSVLPARRHAARGGVRRRRVAVVTAKDKLRRLLGWRMNGICFSAEKAAQANLAENGIVDVLDWVGLPSPDVSARRCPNSCSRPACGWRRRGRSI
jgi:phosphonoacetate hydrolase